MKRRDNGGDEYCSEAVNASMVTSECFSFVKFLVGAPVYGYGMVYNMYLLYNIIVGHALTDETLHFREIVI